MSHTGGLRPGDFTLNVSSECGATITVRDEEHTVFVCTLPRGHRTAHEDMDAAVWTDATHPADGVEAKTWPDPTDMEDFA